MSLSLVGGIALAQSEPDPHDQLLEHAAADISAALAMPRQTDTVTETATAPPVTETVTVTTTQTVMVTSTAPPPSPGCTGTNVAPGSGLKAAMDAAPTGTTFCLSSGTYIVNATITVQNGDVVRGAGETVTHIDGSGLPISASGIFNIDNDARFQDVDVFGAPTPAAGVSGVCNPNADCGKAFVLGNTGTLTLQTLSCHDNDGNCVGGGGSANLVVDDLDCYNNGSDYSSNPNFRYAACIKRTASYSAGGGDTTITNSTIHDNDWVGVWYDTVKFGTLTIQNSTLNHNGRAGIQWEMSGGWSAEDNAVITGNTIKNNGWRVPTTAIPIGGGSGGIAISTAADVSMSQNVFGGNLNSAGGANRAWYAIRTTGRGETWTPAVKNISATNNTLNGDTVDCGTGFTCSGNA